VHFDSLKIFTDLVHTGSFSEAARRSQVTQSAVSQQIRSLEKRLGAQLFERTSHATTPTPEGRVLLEACEQITRLYDDARSRIAEMKSTVQGSLSIATVLSIGLHELPPHIRSFREKYPEAVVEVSYRRASQVYGDVLEGAADLGLVAYPKTRRGLTTHVYARDRLCVICNPAHPLASRKSLRLPELEGAAFIAFEPDAPTRQAIDRVFKIENVHVKRVLEFDNIETVKRAVEIEASVSIVPQRTVRQEVQRGTLCALEIKAPAEEIWRPLGVLRRRSKAVTPAMRAFMHLLEEEEKAES
jgi:DNA-binding transcriptional LysR family regulator